MVVLRLQRIGKKKEPHFRLIAQEKSKDPQDKSLEILGFTNPRTKERRIKKDKVEKWLSNGAQCTDTVYNLLIDEGIIKGDKRKTFKISKKRLGRKEKKHTDETPISADSADKKEETKETKTEGKSSPEISPEKKEVKKEEKIEEKKEIKPNEEKPNVKEEKMDS